MQADSNQWLGQPDPHVRLGDALGELVPICFQPQDDWNLDEIDNLAGIISAATAEIRADEGGQL